MKWLTDALTSKGMQGTTIGFVMGLLITFGVFSEDQASQAQSLIETIRDNLVGLAVAASSLWGMIGRMRAKGPIGQ